MQSISAEIPHRARPAVTLETVAERAGERDSAICAAYEAGVYSIAEIARYFGIHRTSRIARCGVNARNTAPGTAFSAKLPD